MAPAEKTTAGPERPRIVSLVREALAKYVTDPKQREADAAAARGDLSLEAVALLDEMLRKADSYRDGLLVLLAVPLIRGERTDLRVRQEGWRQATEDIGRRVLPELHIKGVKGAFEIIGKNTPELIRGNKPAWDNLLVWASDNADMKELDAAFRYLVTGVAATARTVEPRPRLRLAALTFGRVMRLLSDTLNDPSGGAHEQYILAALLEAGLAHEGGHVRVETKSMSASDRSSRTAGDVEVFHRGRLQEGVEVSANPWRDKLAQAEDAIREHGLPRTHIVAKADEPGLYEALVLATERDVSVLDVRAAVPALVAFLDRRAREIALLRLYELLDQKLASSDLVNAYVRRLREQGMTED